MNREAVLNKGGFRRAARVDQDLAEIQVGTVVYQQLDEREDQLVERLLGWLRATFAQMPARLADLERWEQSWRLADSNADRSVLELGDLAVEASGLLSQATA